MGSTSRHVIIAEIQKSIRELRPELKGDIALGAEFEALGLDSMSQLELLGAIEQTFDVDIPDKDVRSLATVGELVDIIEALTVPS